MYLVVWKAYNIFSFLLPTVFNRQGVYGQPYCPADREGLDQYRVNDQQYSAVSRKVSEKKRTQQSRKVFWVVLSSRFLDFSILGESKKMARDAMNVCLQVLKKVTKVGSTATLSGTVY